MQKRGHVLHICTIVPSRKAGGNIAVLADAYMLKKVFGDVDYLGRYKPDNEFIQIYNTLYYDEKKFGRYEKASNYLLNHYDDFYSFWKKIAGLIDFDAYKYIFLEMAKFEYIVQDLMKRSFKGCVILRSHNVEKYLFDALYSNDRTLINLLKKRSIGIKEQKCLELSDAVLCITQNDAENIEEIYRIPASKIMVLPVGVEKGYENEFDIPSFDANKKKLTCLMTGSLWFGPNVTGIKWFIENVYDSVSNICNIVIAGFKPSNELIELCKKKKIKLIDSPDYMKPLFMDADLFLAPVFSGSGMKVKIAEAMSYGLPIVTTYHGAIGYEMVNELDGYIADDREMFIKCIRDYYNLKSESKLDFRKRVYKKFMELYSYDAMEKTMIQLIDSIDKCI